MPKLSQVLAVEKTIKNATQKTLTEAYHVVQKPALMNGFSKVYQKKDTDGDDFPPEQMRVQIVAKDLVAAISKQLVTYFDTVATKDWANCTAKADVILNGEVLAKDVPATYLLFLEKHLADFKTFITSIPVLEADSDWTFDSNLNVFKTAESRSTKTKKIQKAIVKYPHSVEHPAQTELITVDEIVGSWVQVKQSGALPVPEKQKLLDRVDTLIHAVKFARAEANTIKVEEVHLGAKIFEFLLS